jgi:hypothetical protein
MSFASYLRRTVAAALSAVFVPTETLARVREAERQFSPDAEKMKFTTAEERHLISVAAHAQANATMHHEQASIEMRKTSDALAELARGFQGRI